MKPLTLRERRLVAVGLLVAAIAIGWFAVIRPIVSGFTARAEERRQLILMSQRNQRLLDGVPAIAADAAALRRTQHLFAIQAATPALAAELLRDRVIRVAGQGGGALKTVQIQQVEARPGWVRVRADATLTTAQLHGALRRLQYEEPYAVVDFLSVAADRALETGRAAPLDVRLEISARVRAPAQGRR